MVVSSARTSYPGSRSTVQRPTAESFPALHEKATGVAMIPIVPIAVPLGLTLSGWKEMSTSKHDAASSDHGRAFSVFSQLSRKALEAYAGSPPQRAVTRLSRRRD